MTTYNVQTAKTAALGAAAEDIVNLSGAGRTVTIVNWGAITDIISFTIGPTAGSVQGYAGPPAAVSGADDTFQIRGGTARSSVDLEAPATGKVTVRLISAQTPTYTVQSLPMVD